ncbi:hypothetical protein K435DRAFT_570090, partial [Dendrothele bispora CBS 962.96]
VFLEKLSKVQRRFFRRLLCVSSHSIKAPLYTELGLLPIQYRRIVPSLRYLAYLIACPQHSLAHHTLNANLMLIHRRKLCWLQDPCLVLTGL